MKGLSIEQIMDILRIELPDEVDDYEGESVYIDQPFDEIQYQLEHQQNLNWIEENQ